MREFLADSQWTKDEAATRFLTDVVYRHPDGRVSFIPFADGMVTTIAENIGFSFYGENAPAQQLIDSLRDSSMLLVLDNFEHLLDGVQLVAHLMQAAPHLRIVTTSRERLNLHGETLYTIRGLEFPTWETPEDALQYDAVKLFLQSAHRVRPAFELQTHDLDYLARICRLTAGMPLGIELAAGWVDVFSVEQIAAEIQKGIDILETEMRDVPERHRSIRATFDWTWGRLTDELLVFSRLSIFRGGFTFKAAEAIAGASGRSLRQLVNKALVQVAPDGRHDIHELLRQFGAEKLAASGEQAAIQARHASFFAGFMVERKQDICTNRQLEALQLIDLDFENVRLAWLHVINQQEWEQLPKFLYSLWFYVDVRTRGQEGIELLEQAIETLRSAIPSAETDLATGRLLARLCWFYNDRGFREKALATGNEALHILRQHDDPDDLMAALYSHALAAGFLEQWEAASVSVQEGLSIARLQGDKNWEGSFLIWLGLGRLEVNDLETAFRLAEEALAIFQALGNRWGLQTAYGLIGSLKYEQTDYEAAKHWYHQALLQAEAFGHSHSISQDNTALGIVAIHQQNYRAARRYLRKGLEVCWAAYKRRMWPVPMVVIARLFAEQNETDKAVEVLAVVHKHPISHPGTDEIMLPLLDSLKTKLEPERFSAAWRRGEGRELSAVVTELLAELEE